MIDVNDAYAREVECEYKGEKYRVRDNGAICRLSREGKPKRAKDDVWTFGEKIDRGYAKFCGESVHRIVAVAFLGEPPTKQHVVDHIDTNRQNNRPENLRWLTKLENILQNPYTKAKIEFLCGSVESFLENPSQLKGHESEDANFAWMRAVTPEEAKNTLVNWEKMLSKPRPVAIGRGNFIEEWIFEQNRPKTQKTENIFDDFEQETTSAEQVFEIPQQPVMRRNMDIKPKGAPVSKKEFMTALTEICENEGWTYEKYYKAENWKADVLITVGGQQFAFMAFSSLSTASKVLPLMEADGVYGLVLSPKRDIKDSIACFGLQKDDGGMMVKVEKCELPLSEFVKKAVDGKIIHRTSALIKSVEVMFPIMNCYECGTPHSVYFVRYLVDEKEKKYDLADMLYGYDEELKSKLPDLQFGDEILGMVKRYVAEHPETKIVMGEVKERYSKTMGESYMSFGCPKCDSIVGDYYLNDLGMDVMYETDENLMHRMQVVTPFEAPVNEWDIKE